MIFSARSDSAAKCDARVGKDVEDVRNQDTGESIFSPFSIFRPKLLPPRKMQFRDCEFHRNSLIIAINQKDYFFVTNAIDTL